MRITDAKVIVTCPGRNFVTLKLTTEDGLTGLGDATLNGRELAVASYLADHVVPLLIGRDARRIEDTWQYLYKGAYWRRGPVTMAAIAAVDTALWDIKAQGGRHAALPAARRRVARGGAGLRPRQRQGHRRRRPRRRRATSIWATRRSACSAACPGLASTYGVGQGHACPTSRPRRALPSENVVEHRGLRRLHPDAVRARPRRVRAGGAPAARRPPPPDADRGGARRQEPRAVPAVLDGGSGAGGAAGRLPPDPPAHDDADRGRRGVQHDLRLPAADHGAADRLHPHHRGARRRHHATCARSPRSPSCITCAPAATAPPISARSAWRRRCTST